jgi:hypothetical protein
MDGTSFIVEMWQTRVSNYRLNKTAEFTQIENLCLRNIQRLKMKVGIISLQF